jgi:hypothetical protein
VQANVSADGALVVTYESTALPKAILAAGALFVLIALYEFAFGARHIERIVGLMVGGGICAVGGLALLERSRFVFDPAARTVTWRRQHGWSSSSGTLAFTAIQDVVVETTGEGRTYPNRRLCLRLANAPLLPLTAGLAPDPRGDIVAIAERIRRVLGR